MASSRRTRFFLKTPAHNGTEAASLTSFPAGMRAAVLGARGGIGNAINHAQIEQK
jgi:hypothetical protein